MVARSMEEMLEVLQREVETLKLRKNLNLGAFGGGLPFARANPVRNPDWRVNQRGYVSGAALPPQSYGPDGWCASGLVNLSRNPNVRTGVTDWATTSLTNATATRQTGLSGGPVSGVTTFLRHAFTGSAGAGTGGPFYRGPYDNAALMPLVSGKLYRVSIWVRSNVAKSVALSMQWNNSVAATLGTPVVLVANTWTRLTEVFTAPANITSAGPYVYPTGSNTWANGNTIDALGLMVVEGSLDPDSFDGDASGCIWSGTSNLSASYNVASVGTITLPTAPQGGLATLSSGMQVFQPIERADIAAGDFTATMPGTAKGRVYNASTALGARPAFAAFPFTVTLDGEDDVIFEAWADGGTATFGNIQLVPGEVAQPYVPRQYSEELAICQRYLRRWGGVDYTNIPLLGMQASTTLSRVRVIAGINLRALPVIMFSNICISDNVAFEASISAIGFTLQHAASDVSALVLEVTHSSAGVARYPVGSYVRNASGGYLQLDAEIRKFAA